MTGDRELTEVEDLERGDFLEDPGVSSGLWHKDREWVTLRAVIC
jgi:hypothetical protein